MLQTGVERVRFSFVGRDAWTSVASTNGVVILREGKVAIPPNESLSFCHSSGSRLMNRLVRRCRWG